MKKSILILFAVAMFANLQTSAQSKVIFERTETAKYVIRSTSADNLAKKAIMSRLAKGYSKSPSSLKINFSFQETKQILKNNQNLTFLVSLSRMKITGDTKYKGFPVGEFLIPAQMSMDLDWKKKNGTLMQNYKFNRINVKAKGVTEAVNKTVRDSTGSSFYIIKTKNKNFIYEASAQRKFEKKANYIDQYYSEIDKIERKVKAIEKINPNEETMRHLEHIEVVYDYKDLASKSLVFAENIERKDFYTSLPLNRIDPMQMKQKVENLISKSKALLHSAEHIISELHLIYYDKGMEEITHGHFGEADRFFKLSIKQKPEFTPPHYQIAKMLYNSGHTADAVNEIFEIRGMNPDPQTKQLTIELGNGIYRDYVLLAADLNNARKYDQALSVLKSAKMLCTDFPEVACRATMDAEYEKAIWGKYDIILANADNQFNNKKLYDAEQILLSAKDFKDMNSYVIKTNEDIIKRLEKIYFKHIDIGNALISRKDFNKSLKSLEEAQRICSTYPELVCTQELNQSFFDARMGEYSQMLTKAENSYNANRIDDSERNLNSAISYRKQYNLTKDEYENILFKKIQQKRYDNAIKKGLLYEKSHNYKEALSEYDKARSISGLATISTNKYLTRYIEKASENYILQLCSSGEREVLVNKLPQARSFYTKAIDIQNIYNHNSTKQVNAALEQLKDKIFKQECVNAQDKFNGIMSQATKHIAGKRYIKATEKINEALLHAQKFSFCGINTQNANNTKSDIADGVSYEGNMNEVKNNIRSQRYQAAINSYISTSELFDSKNIKRYNIVHKELYDFILQERNGSFSNVAAEYYTDKNEFAKALQLLKTLKSSSFSRSSTKVVQTKLGTALASKDFKNTPTQEWKTGVAHYTAGDRYYKYLKKAYKKQWKRLD